jgi:hypothetical protein
MTRVAFYDPSFFTDNYLVYSVIAARYYGQWIFVRHVESNTWEMAGDTLNRENLRMMLHGGSLRRRQVRYYSTLSVLEHTPWR